MTNGANEHYCTQRVRCRHCWNGETKDDNQHMVTGDPLNSASTIIIIKLGYCKSETQTKVIWEQTEIDRDEKMNIGWNATKRWNHWWDERMSSFIVSMQYPYPRLAYFISVFIFSFHSNEMNILFKLGWIAVVKKSTAHFSNGYSFWCLSRLSSVSIYLSHSLRNMLWKWIMIYMNHAYIPVVSRACRVAFGFTRKYLFVLLWEVDINTARRGDEGRRRCQCNSM